MTLHSKFTLHKIILTSVSIVLFSVGCSKTPEPETPAIVKLSPAEEGSRILKQMSGNLANASTMSFETVESLDRIGADATAGPHQFTRSVVVKRPNSLSFVLNGVDNPNLKIDANFDGQNVTLQNTSAAAWARTPVVGNIDVMFDSMSKQFSLPIPIADVVYSNPYEAFIGPNTKGGVAGMETIDSIEYVRLEYADEFVGIKIWTTDAADALPKRIELTYKTVAGAPKAIIDFSAWKLNTPITDDAFTTSIDPSSKEHDFGALVAAILASKPEANAANATETTP